jgi:hypothetical protein
VATSLKQVKLEAKEATKLIKAAKKIGAYSDAVPKTDKEKNDAVNEIIAFCVDAWVSEGVRPDSEDEEEAAAGEQVIELLALAGMEIDDDNDITYEDDDEDDDDETEDDENDDDEDDVWDEESLTELKTAELKEVAEEFEVEVPDGKMGAARKRKIIAEILEAQEENEDEDDEDDDDDESAFEIDDTIEGYDELSPASKVKAIKKLGLDEDDDDDAAVLNAIRDHENEQDKPAGRVITLIDDLIGEVDEDDEDDDDENDEPIEGYDDASITEIKEALVEAAGEDDEDDRLTTDNIEAIVEYEKENKNRKTFIKWLEGDLTEMLEEKEEEEEKPAPKKSRGKKGKKTSDPDDSDEVDNAVSKDDDEFVEKVANAVLMKIADLIESMTD